MSAAFLVSLTAALLSASADELYEVHSFTYTGGEYENEEFKYRLLKPEKIEQGKQYPVVLFLHGAGERGDDNKNQLKYFPELMATPEMRKKYPCFVIAPQCRKGKKWWEVPWGERKSRPADEEPSDMMKTAIGILQHVLKEYPTDRRRVYLTGLSMGGYGSWDLAARHPDWFAAVVPICGGGDERQAEKLKEVPIWAFHGSADKAVPTVRSQQMIEAIKEAGGSPKYTEFEGVGHNSWTPAYRKTECIPWMFQQAKGK